MLYLTGNQEYSPRAIGSTVFSPEVFHETQELEWIWTARGSSLTKISQKDIQHLEQLYVFRRRLDTLGFLEKYPFLVPLLIEAHYYIELFFPYSQIFLATVTDPEEFGSDQLVASIATNLDPEKATDALSIFDKTWWLKALKQAQGKLCITLEFQ